MQLSNKIEAILFYEADYISKKKLSELLNIDLKSLADAISELKRSLENRSISIVETDTHIALRIKKEYSKFIMDLFKKRVSQDLGKSALEVLSIIIYMSPISKQEIDYIRGVNSANSIKSLLIRGLIQKNKINSNIVYEPTPDALSYLGIVNKQDMIEYKKVARVLKDLLNKEYEEE